MRGESRAPGRVGPGQAGVVSGLTAGWCRAGHMGVHLWERGARVRDTHPGRNARSGQGRQRGQGTCRLSVSLQDPFWSWVRMGKGVEM